jgi:hypothetical protein
MASSDSTFQRLRSRRWRLRSTCFRGVVDNESDKTVAGLSARGVPGSFGVENDLVVERARKTH